jgi:purine-nucleoside phosphorylase
MNDKELAQKIIDEAKHWTEMQYNIKAGIVGAEAYYRNQAQARLELLEHIKETFIEMRENAEL